MLVDSHCHLTYPGLREDQPAVLARARAAGVGAMLAISTEQSEWAEVVGLADAEPDIFATIGVHPHAVDRHPATTQHLLEAAASAPRVVGIGETGLDYHYELGDAAAQRASFRAHIGAARSTGLPLVIHTRDAEADTAAILAEELATGPFSAVIHCFTASQSFAEQALAMGFYISLSGIVTFRNARDLQATAALIPADRLLVETDAPYLAPVPMRGRTCEPAYVAHTAAFVADLRGISPSELATTTTDNFFRLFSKAVRP